MKRTALLASKTGCLIGLLSQLNEGEQIVIFKIPTFILTISDLNIILRKNISDRKNFV